MSSSAILVMRRTGERPWRVPGSDELMTLTLHADPPDYPNHYVLRAWYMSELRFEPATPVLLFRTMAEAEPFVDFAFPHMTWIGREMTNNPEVVGCWL